MYHFLQMEEESILVHRGEVGEPDAGTQVIPVECRKVALLPCCCSAKTASDLVSTEQVIQYLQAHLILSVGDLCAHRPWTMSQLYMNSSWRCLGQATQQGKRLGPASRWGDSRSGGPLHVHRILCGTGGVGVSSKRVLRRRGSAPQGLHQRLRR
jgi:hypothetical protein